MKRNRTHERRIQDFKNLIPVNEIAVKRVCKMERIKERELITLIIASYFKEQEQVFTISEMAFFLSLNYQNCYNRIKGMEGSYIQAYAIDKFRQTYSITAKGLLVVKQYRRILLKILTTIETTQDNKGRLDIPQIVSKLEGL